MDDTADARGQVLEQYRDYLNLLVRTQMTPQLQGKLDLSGVVQQTLLDAHRSGRELTADDSDALTGWLRRILATNMVIVLTLICNNPEFQSNDALGYVFLFAVFSLVFFGVRSYRNKKFDGFITFGKALKTGTLIAFLGSTVYVVTGLFYYYVIAPDLLDHLTEHALYQAESGGATESELDEVRESMAQLAKMYENPLLVILLSYSIVFPIGFLVALVSSFILKRKPQKAIE
jgi:hypothetical protein